MEDNNLKQQITDLLRANPTKRFRVEDVSDALGYHGSAAFKLIVQEFARLEREQIAVVTSEGEFQLNEKARTLNGVFHANDKGFGFVAYDDELPDAYIAPDNTMLALNGDEVDMEIVRAADPHSDRGPEGKVTGIDVHHYTHVVGAFTQTDDDKGYYGQVRLTDKKLSRYKFYVVDTGLKPTPEVVTAEITEYPNADHPLARGWDC